MIIWKFKSDLGWQKRLNVFHLFTSNRCESQLILMSAKLVQLITAPPQVAFWARPVGAKRSLSVPKHKQQLGKVSTSHTAQTTTAPNSRVYRHIQSHSHMGTAQSRGNKRALISGLYVSRKRPETIKHKVSKKVIKVRQYVNSKNLKSCLKIQTWIWPKHFTSLF